MNTIKLLLVEDDEDFSNFVKVYLEQTGRYQVVLAKDGRKGIEAFNTNEPDIIVTDVDMPKMTGLEMIDLIRKVNRNIPILIASGLISENQIIEGQKHEIDNYIQKPYTPQILDGYIKSFLRHKKDNERVMTENNKVFPLGDYWFDVENRQLKYEAEIISVTKREAQILQMLYNDKGHLVQRKHILNVYWGEGDKHFQSRCLDVIITNLRNYLRKDKSIQIITKRGEGLILQF